MRLEESQKAYADLKIKFDNVENNYKEQINELQAKFDNLEGQC